MPFNSEVVFDEHAKPRNRRDNAGFRVRRRGDVSRHGIKSSRKTKTICGEIRHTLRVMS